MMKHILTLATCLMLYGAPCFAQWNYGIYFNLTSQGKVNGNLIFSDANNSNLGIVRGKAGGGLEFLHYSNSWVQGMNYDNLGNLGIGTNTPRGRLDVSGGDVYLVGNTSQTNGESLVMPGHLYLIPHGTGNISYLQSRRIGDLGSTEIRIRTWNNGVGTEAMHIDNLGRIGIGSLAPIFKLDVNLGGYNNLPKIAFNQKGDNPMIMLYRPVGSGNLVYPWRIENTANGRLNFSSGAPTNAGDEVVTPQISFFPNGLICTKEIKVSLSGPSCWSDYVFSNDYRLRPLSEVEAFINQNKHLPEVPSAKEVEENGVNLGETDALLLKKIEELTLYVIEQNKKIEKLEKEMNRNKN